MHELAKVDAGPDLVLYFKHMMTLRGQPDYALHFIETDRLSPSQQGWIEAQLRLFDSWYAGWSKAPEVRAYLA